MDKSINKKRIILALLIVAACVLIIFVISTVSLVAYLINNQDDDTERDTGEPNFTLVGKKIWNGLYVDADLYEDLLTADGEKNFKLKAWPLNIPSEFIYEGKSYAQYECAYKESEKLLEKLEALREDGEDLKYGELLYKGGAPNGAKWTQERYRYKTEEYYGAEMLGKYIVNGEFLLEKLQSEIVNAKAQKENLKNEMHMAERAYYQEILSLFKEIDSDAALKNGAVYFSVSKEQLACLPDKYKGHYVFVYEHYGAADN